VPDFAASELEICAGETIQFSSTSTNATILFWTFPGGAPMNSTDLAPVVTYSTGGQFSVVLNAINACGNVQEIKHGYIRVLPIPSPGFEASTSGLSAVFENLSEDAASYLWEFGDGQTSGLENPTHTYSAAGTYLVSLTATNDCGSVSFSMEITVTTVGTDAPEWLESFQLYPNPSAGAFWVEMKGKWPGDVQFYVFDPTGKLLRMETIASPAEAVTQKFDLGGIPAGQYWLRIRTGGMSWLQKVLIAR
jgi:PKD repeat protein